MSITFHTESSHENLELNVANRNGYVILRELLDIVDPEPWGSLAASAVIRKLSVAAARVHGATIPASDTQGERVTLSPEGVSVERTCRVIDCGLDTAQVERYIYRLSRLARYAELQGEEILWD